MGTLYFLMVLFSFVCIFYSTRKKQGYLTIADLLISALIAMVPMFNLVIAFYSLAEAGILNKKIL